MRYLHTLSLLVALSSLLACGNAREVELPIHPLPLGWGVGMLLEHVSVKPGDHVDVILVNGDQETTVLRNVEVASVTVVDKHTDAVDVNVSGEDAQDFMTAVKTVTHDRTRLQKTSTN